MRLIDADAVIDELDEATNGLEEEFPTDTQVKTFMCCVRMTACFIETAKTIDAEPVVRCEECKKWEGLGNGTGICRRSFNALYWIGTDATDFCSFAERKDNA